ncbi:hypothetical protein MNBD_GAMMA14-466 [hydrothermal vent metagenome]|uniref:Uncharacterized protein n=1 Tax=hydrothermal vent metagenome TaxID=652676 RepID=A0A3B0YTJ6_9ZZZZ
MASILNTLAFLLLFFGGNMSRALAAGKADISPKPLLRPVINAEIRPVPVPVPVPATVTPPPLKVQEKGLRNSRASRPVLPSVPVPPPGSETPAAPVANQRTNVFGGKGRFLPPLNPVFRVPDSVRTGQLSLIGKPPPPQVPDIVRTSQLILTGKPQVPDTVNTGQLSQISRTQIPDIVPTGPLILKGEK